MSMGKGAKAPGIDAIRDAAERIRPYIHRTPVMACEALSEMTGAEIFFKCENFQKVGAFKFRGAVNTVFSLSEDEIKRGVTTHSSGNHAQALALAARERGVKACIVMPENAPRVKVEAVRGYGGDIIFCEPTLEAREKTVEAVKAKTGAAFVHPYNDYRVIAGQGTCAMELLDEIGDLDVVMAPVGGGGLISGTAIATSALSPETKIVAAEPSGADDAYRSVREGRRLPSVNPQTIADGLRTSLGDLTFPIIRECVHEIVTVAEKSIIDSMRHIWERMKIIVEPSGVVPFGAVLEKSAQFKGRRIGIILSGGNVDLDRLPWQL